MPEERDRAVAKCREQKKIGTFARYEIELWCIMALERAFNPTQSRRSRAVCASQTFCTNLSTAHLRLRIPIGNRMLTYKMFNPKS